MNYKIRYYKSNTDQIVTLAKIECNSIHTRNIGIDSVMTSLDGISLFLSTLPRRIDKQGDTVIIMDDDFSRNHPLPYGLFDNTAYWGYPLTIWSPESNPVSPDQ